MSSSDTVCTWIIGLETVLYTGYSHPVYGTTQYGKIGHTGQLTNHQYPILYCTVSSKNGAKKEVCANMQCKFVSKLADKLSKYHLETSSMAQSLAIKDPYPPVQNTAVWQPFKTGNDMGTVQYIRSHITYLYGYGFKP